MTNVKRIGLTPISKDPSSNTFVANIVFVHGLRGHPKGSWEKKVSPGSGQSSNRKQRSLATLFKPLRKDEGVEQVSDDIGSEQTIFWPEQFLDLDLSNAAIYTYGYNADLIANFVHGGGQGSITQFALNLMRTVAVELNEKPIVFVAHSLGGIVVKKVRPFQLNSVVTDSVLLGFQHRSADLLKALVESKEDPDPINKRLYERTRYILFLGTPHRGASITDWGIILANVATITLQDVDKKVLIALGTNSEILENVQKAFRRILDDRKLQILSFQEERGISGVKGLSSKVVEDYSSKMESSYETVQTIDANHVEMARYGTRDDDGYNKVHGALRIILEKLETGEDGVGSPFETYTSIDQVFDQQLSKIKSWIRPPNCRSDESNVLRPRTDDETSRWILNESEYQRWVTRETQRLWICGPPGCGKSVIASVIAQDLRRRFTSNTRSGSETFIGIAYCLKNDEEKRDALAIIKTLARHLIDKDHLLPREKSQIILHWQKGEPTQDSSAGSARRDLQYALILLLRDVLAGRVAYLIVDGLDECHNPREVARELVEAFKTISEKSKVHILVVSQNLSELSSVFGGDSAKIDLDNDQAKVNRERDVDLIVSRSLQQSEAQDFIRNIVPIKAKLLQKADGVVLWAILALGNITRITEHSKDNDDNILRLVEELPSEGVHSMYKHMLGRLEETLIRNDDEEGLLLVTSILCWTTWTVRSLKIEELCVALAIGTHTQGPSTSDRAYPILDGAVATVKRQVNRLCYPFLRIQQDETVAVAHSTFKDFITSLDQNSQSLGPILSRLRSTEAARSIVQGCLSYLLQKPFNDFNLIMNDDFDKEKFDSEHKFYAYAAFNLKTHAIQAGPLLDSADELVADFYFFIHHNQGLTWISRLFSDGRVGYRKNDLQWSLNVGLARSCKKDWLLVLLTGAIELYKEATVEVSLAQISMMTYLASLLASQGSYDEAEHMYWDILTLDDSTNIKEDELLSIKSSLGLTLINHGRLAEAAEILEDTLSKKKGRCGVTVRDTVSAQDNLACCYRYQHRYHDAMKLFTEAASSATHHLGREDSTTICIFNNLAVCHGCCAQWLEARRILEENLVILEKGHSEESQLLTCMNNLASAYDKFGSMEKAENLYREGYERRLVIYGASHADTQTSLNNLAFAFLRQSKYQDAEGLYKKALELATRRFGYKHRTTLMTAGNYGDALWNLGKDKEALQLRSKTFQILKSMPSVERDDVDLALHAVRLACHRQAEWNWEEAERLLVEALKIQYEKLGSEHDEVATSITNLATNCWERNLLRAALELTNKAYMIERSVFGDQHPDTITSLLDRGVYLRLLGNYADARTSIEEGLELGKNVLGSENRSYVVAKGYLAALLADLGELETAKDLYTEVWEYLITRYGLGHKSSLLFQTHLAQVHQRLGNLGLAKSLQEEAFEKRIELHGENHLLTSASKCDLAHLLQETGFFTEALSLAKPALEIRRAIIGPKHRVTLQSEHGIGLVYQRLGAYEEAEDHLLISATERQQLFGLAHVQTLNSLHDLAILYKDTDRLEDAVCLLRSVVGYRSSVLGHQHRDTNESRDTLQTVLQNTRTTPKTSDAKPISKFLSGLDIDTQSELEAFEELDGADQASKSSIRRTKDLQRILQEMSKVLGEDFPLTLDVSRRLALEMVVQNHYHDALPLFERVWRLQFSDLQGANPHAAKLLVEYVTCLMKTKGLEAELSCSLKHALSISILTENKRLFKLLVEGKANPNIPCDDGSTPLLHATLLGLKGKRLISELLKLGAKQIPRNDGKTPLMIAFENSYEDIFDTLLDNEGDYMQCSSNGQSLLYQASAQGNPHFVHALLNAGADPCQMTSEGHSPLHIATCIGHLEIMKALVQAGASPAAATAIGGFTPLFIASEWNQENALQYLLSVGAKADIVSERGYGPIHVAAEKNSVAIVSRLLDAGVDMEQTSQNSMSYRPIHSAAQNSGVDVIRELLRRGAAINSRTGNGARALHLACECGKAAVVEFLLDAGAAVNVQMPDRVTPFYCAAMSGQVDKLTLLLGKGKAEPHILKEGGFSPLHAAAEKGHAHIVDSLMSLTKSDPDLQTETGCCALHLAAANGHSKVIGTLLLRWNANPRIQHHKGHTALHFSTANRHKDALQQLLNHDPQLANVQDNDGYTPLHFTVAGNQISLIEPLVKAGADVHIEAAGPLNPLMLAIWKHSGDAVRHLIKKGAKLDSIDCFGMNYTDWAALRYSTDPALEKKWRRVKPTTPAQRSAALSRNIPKLAQRLLHPGSRLETLSLDTSGLLGRCLLRAANTADALLALQLSAIASSAAASGNNAGEVTYYITCDLCNTERITGVRYVCRVCPDYDLCGSCMRKYEARTEKLQGCVDHEYLEVGALEWKRIGHDGDGDLGWENGDGESVGEWVARLSKWDG